MYHVWNYMLQQVLLNIFVSEFFLKFAGPLQSFKSLSYEFHKFTLLWLNNLWPAEEGLVCIHVSVVNFIFLSTMPSLYGW